MLIGIDGRISPQLLFVLSSMGHGDEIAIVDSNFPASSTAAYCQIGEPIDLLGINAVECIELIAGIMPLDSFVDHSALRMEIDNAPDELGPVHEDASVVLNKIAGNEDKFGSIERQEFYERSKSAFAVIRTGETRPYGCFLLRKGVIF
ncbi:RbsD/FucU domain-containing protein [Ahrensia kielensis]|uniref:RbsD/FucU domain-containing protein n=1 Tax=Ahrensia kielensis TaxID=76980 RepID=A0ABU9T7E5_9HYPH